MTDICKHCKTHCGRIRARGLGERCYRTLRQAGRLAEYPKVTGWRKRQVKYPITAEQHEQIRAVYQSATGDRQVKDLAGRLGLPRWRVTRYAIEQGWTARNRKEPNWSVDELRLLKEYSRYTPATIKRKLGEHGYARSMTGIVLKRKRMHFLSELGGISATRMAAYLGVDSHLVTRAIDEGRLRAEHRGTGRTEHQGGDSWYIKPDDIRAFIISNLHEIDIRKVDKYWFVGLLAGPPEASAPGRPPAQGASIFEAVHMDEEYFYCRRKRCTLKKEVCVRRQVEGVGDIKVDCEKCEQGREIARELAVKQAA